MTEYRIHTRRALEGEFARQAVPVIAEAKSGDVVYVDNSVLGNIVSTLLRSTNKEDVRVVTPEDNGYVSERAPRPV